MPGTGRNRRRAITGRARRIRLLILDVDGVMTDGRIILDNNGNEYKAFHVRDGHGIKMLIRAGIRVAIITGRGSKVVAIRAKELGISDVFQRCRDKSGAYSSLLRRHGLTDEEVAYIGDDIVDLPVMARVGLPVAVADADPGIRRFCQLVTERAGGRGAVREVADLLLKAQGLWEDLADEFTKA